MDKSIDPVGRREFLKAASLGASVMMLVAKPPLRAQAPLGGPAIRFGVIGTGQWGKDILANLARLPSAQVTAVCDSYEPYLKKSREIAPKAAAFTDFRRVLDAADVDAVVIATPSHQHKDIVLAALAAGKHVYCEAPLASTIADAKAIATAAQSASKQIFQGGLQGRSNALYKHVSSFVKASVLGTPVLVTGQWNKRQSWRRAAPNAEREKELNWRLSAGVSSGLLGEIGVHQLDLVNWYLNALPVAVSGYGATLSWNDGRDVPDTVQAVFEYPKKVRAVFSSTLASSFSDAFTLFQGNNSSLLMRERRGWMMKEADSPLLGWEVYARKESVHNESAVCMIAAASKILESGNEPGKDGSVEPTQDALYLAFENFCRSIRRGGKPVCGPLEAYRSTVTALQANEAISTGTRIVFPKTIFEL